MTRLKKILKLILFEIRFLLLKSSYVPKVFCVGFNKTGTTTLGKSFELLGYRNSSFNKNVWRNYYLKGRIDKVLYYTSKFDSFDDLPWLKEDLIPVLDENFPGSKFVYLERNIDDWKNSISNWTFKMKGYYPDLDSLLDEYNRHREFILTYFKNRTSDLLILQVDDPKGFEKLSIFLDRPIIADNFSVHNKTANFNK